MCLLTISDINNCSGPPCCRIGRAVGRTPGGGASLRAMKKIIIIILVLVLVLVLVLLLLRLLILLIINVLLIILFIQTLIAYNHSSNNNNNNSNDTKNAWPRRREDAKRRKLSGYDLLDAVDIYHGNGRLKTIHRPTEGVRQKGSQEKVTFK